MKDLVARNGQNIAAVRKAFESNDNDAITKALNDLDGSQAELASLANNQRQQDQAAGQGNTKPTSDQQRAGFSGAAGARGGAVQDASAGNNRPAGSATNKETAR